jgi:alkanesulfonate monooxygenase SsuD/methylene tetrahydromethanopterin reductase-like flavin-dependent oxidoreductase (luciferase family)
LVEHHFAGEYSHSSAPELFLAAASQRTKAIRLGHGVIVLPYHHPIHVAERAAALDVLSSGRLELGIGRGFSASEYAAFGVQMRDSRDYVKESLAILRQAFTGPLSHRGRLFDFQGVDVVPKPMQRPHPPMWTAAVSPESFIWAAREGLGAMAGPFKPWFLIRQDLASYRRTWRECHGTNTPMPGQNPRFATTVGVLCLEDGSEARQLAGEAFIWYYRHLLDQTRPILQSLQETYEYYRSLGRLHFLLQRAISMRILESMGMVVVGDPDECARHIARFQRAGIDHLICAVGAGVLPTSIVQRSLRVMAKYLLPRFQG